MMPIAATTTVASVSLMHQLAAKIPADEQAAAITPAPVTTSPAMICAAPAQTAPIKPSHFTILTFTFHLSKDLLRWTGLQRDDIVHAAQRLLHRFEDTNRCGGYLRKRSDTRSGAASVRCCGDQPLCNLRA